ncbi:hypothetical protein FPFC_030870 [Fructobacillus pseudoficulneus]|uniref:DUF805 domain-containing protein n=1 Tax=Fructobacillus pseudoficulneus TaxID=220714 RepID=A0A3F3GXM5_9LACO|nr:DUF805 domain-containing protein [Fructobacillus pseudoficulneus]GAP02907.1 hypothetical protein FPFC_030870 [Fructobacillus pseudoficulneus]SEH46734.1 Uncharacterized membrane protein YhaH, DUF805 family [Fructobacillus pseudoficulneus]
MLAAYKKYWKDSLRFDGRASRSDFWLVVLVNHFLVVVGVLAGVGLLSVAINDSIYANNTKLAEFSMYSAQFLLITLFFYLLATIVPNLSMQCRRLGDAGLSAGWLALVAVAYVVPLVVVALFALDFFDIVVGVLSAGLLAWTTSIWAITVAMLFAIDVSPTDAYRAS